MLIAVHIHMPAPAAFAMKLLHFLQGQLLQSIDTMQAGRSGGSSIGTSSRTHV
jgi:hypothetical protein